MNLFFTGIGILILSSFVSLLVNEKCKLKLITLFSCIAMFFFAPFFGQATNENIQAVSLLSFVETSSYLRIIYFAIVISIIAMGILTLTLKKFQNTFWIKNKSKISLILNAIGILIFIISTQPYAAAFMFVLLIIKALLLIKWQ